MESIVNDALKKVKRENDFQTEKSGSIYSINKDNMNITEEELELEKILKSIKTKIIVVGCGGSGCNTINRMMDEGIEGAKLIAMNTDAQHLLNIRANKKLLIGKKCTKGFGAGGIPQIGEKAAKESESDIENTVNESDMVFITCGLGGGTGTGSAPIVAECAKNAGSLSISVVTLPFTAEGTIRAKNAEIGLEKLRKASDTVIVIPNDKLLEAVPRLPLQAAFKVADEVLMRAVKGITELITKPGLVNLDFADVKTIMHDGGVAMIGLGEADGENRAIEAIKKALKSPLLDMDISDATSALVNVSGGPDMTITEAQGIVEEIYRNINTNANIIWGAQIDPDLKNKIRVMIIITGVKSPQILGKSKSPRDSQKEYGIDFVR
ncbi:MAG: cell division protein FtsZ [Candidatus Methanoliparum thermophilum]|uniref:Cell division protein FtsZ n=1 Tax=Methanoliparum thermophilum TaxID=2491083 RepID=A0A520KTK0_METT2|nr:cell division protein FtsZ [Candidatus Methanoliparum sp. LAM-1]RZN65405.1 MAG: cell division protein FtsZ [Candidatus Methanoliparum thermophilum]BDC35506.1 cell division protein FtsZ [Candidatus Methanoliparum sp. LAM-1]